MRHDDEPDVRSYAVTHLRGALVLPQNESWDQLVYSSRGTVTVHTDSGSWVVPPLRAVWVPGGLRHRIDVAGRASLRIVYLRRAPHTRPAQVFAVAPLLRELILHIVTLAPLHLTVPRDTHLVAVLLDLLDDVPPEPALRLPALRDPRARTLADLLRADASTPLPALARAAGASRRTLERLFLTETGMTIGAWRRRLRMLEALRLLASAEPRQPSATQTPSAFSAAIHTELSFPRPASSAEDQSGKHEPSEPAVRLRIRGEGVRQHDAEHDRSLLGISVVCLFLPDVLDLSSRVRGVSRSAC